MAKQRKPEARAGHFEEALKGVSPSLQREMRKLRASEGKILAALEDPQTRDRFIARPLQTLEEMGVTVPPVLRRRLKALDPESVRHLNTQTFVLPNGQTIRPRVNIRFTGERKG